MKLPINPEPLETLRARYPAAIARLWDFSGMTPMQAMAAALKDRPGLHPEHVFDFENGVRMIISRERPDGPDGEVIHYSASVSDGSEAWRMLKAARPFTTDGVKLKLALLAQDAFEELTGTVGGLARWDDIAGIPHFYLEVGG